ncbi:MAG: hypothetical protein OEX12_14770 [Gammaproteobacteria bacterium]|nr:hypothetical protein [Gammaproteobacteria bacterium]
MKQHRLDFITINEYETGIIEAIVDDGEDIGAEKLLLFIEFLNNLPSQPSALLIDRINNYSMGFSAFTVLGKNKVIKMIAVVNHGKRNQIISTDLWPKFLNIAFFNDRDSAIHWLNNRLAFSALK